MALSAQLARRTTLRLASASRRAHPTARPGATARSQQQQRRTMGSGQPESQSMQAKLWEGHSAEPEGWEKTLYATYAVGFGIIAATLGFAPDTTIATWANNEAQARLDLQAAGKLDKPEFGVHYDTPEKKGYSGEWDDFMAKSVKPGEDDDEDDEDEDEDEEEDDDDDE